MNHCAKKSQKEIDKIYPEVEKNLIGK